MTCNRCGSEVTSLDYIAKYTETVSGPSYGKYYLDSGNTEVEETNPDYTDDFTEYDYIYFCPECNLRVDLETVESILTPRKEEIKITQIDITDLLENVIAICPRIIGGSVIVNRRDKLFTYKMPKEMLPEHLKLSLERYYNFRFKDVPFMEDFVEKEEQINEDKFFKMTH